MPCHALPRLALHCIALLSLLQNPRFLPALGSAATKSSDKDVPKAAFVEIGIENARAALLESVSSPPWTCPTLTRIESSPPFPTSPARFFSGK